MSIRQAMGTPKGRDAAAAYVAQFMSDIKRTGFLADAFARNQVKGGSLAP